MVGSCVQNEYCRDWNVHVLLEFREQKSGALFAAVDHDLNLRSGERQENGFKNRTEKRDDQDHRYSGDKEQHANSDNDDVLPRIASNRTASTDLVRMRGILLAEQRFCHHAAWSQCHLCGVPPYGAATATRERRSCRPAGISNDPTDEPKYIAPHF